MTPTRIVLMAAVAGAAAVVAGVAGVAGPWWALIAAGVFVLIGAVLQYDPESQKVDHRRYARGGRPQ